MDKNFCSILSKLKVVAKIQSGHKILIDDDQIHIIEVDKNNMDRLKKWWSGETRYTTLSKLRALYLEVNDLIQDYGQCVNTNSISLERLKLEITNSIRGLENLMITYKEDRMIVSELETLVENYKLLIRSINDLISYANSIGNEE